MGGISPASAWVPGEKNQVLEIAPQSLSQWDGPNQGHFTEHLVLTGLLLTPVGLCAVQHPPRDSTRSKLDQTVQAIQPWETP